MSAQDDIDPFGSDKAPAVSWKDAPVGTVVTMKVSGPAKLVQSTDFKTKEPAKWPDGNPKMSVVINGTVDGEERSLWAPKPSALFAAIAEAQKAVGQNGKAHRLREGDTLLVKFTGTKPTTGDPQKLFAAKIEVGTPRPSGDDPFGDTAQGASSLTTMPAQPTGKTGWDEEPPF